MPTLFLFTVGYICALLYLDRTTPRSPEKCFALLKSRYFTQYVLADVIRGKERKISNTSTIIINSVDMEVKIMFELVREGNDFIDTVFVRTNRRENERRVFMFTSMFSFITLLDLYTDVVFRHFPWNLKSIKIYFIFEERKKYFSIFPM